jgi:hypothetical protein
LAAILLEPRIRSWTDLARKQANSLLIGKASQHQENIVATDVIGTPGPFIKERVYRPVSRLPERVFFGGMAILLCAVVIVGFSPTYYRAGIWKAPLPSPILHIHGAVFTVWMLLYLTQTALISAKRIAWHRSLGTVAFCVPPIMIVLGVMAALDALKRGVTIGPLDTAVSLAIPLLGIASFTVVIFASWRARRSGAAHKRLILLASIGLVEAGFGRFPWAQIGLAPAAGAVTGLALLLVLVLAYDLFSLHRIHRSTMWALPVTFVLNGLAVPIGMTAAWHSFAAFVEPTDGLRRLEPDFTEQPAARPQRS